MAKKKTVHVHFRGGEQWSFEPMEEGENYFITPRFARMPPLVVGAELRDSKKQIGMVTAFGSYQGSSMKLHYEPTPVRKQRRKVPKKVKVEVQSEKVEDGQGSSGVGSS